MAPVVIKVDNSDYMQLVASDLTEIQTYFPGILTAKPLTLEQGGVIAPFDIKTAAKFYSKNKKYQFGGNALWASPQTPPPELSLSKPKRLQLMPRDPCQLHLVVGVDKDITENELKKMIDARDIMLAMPPEKFHGWLLGFADACRSKDDAKCKEWYALALTTQFDFVHASQDDCNWMSMQK
eukprot:10138417-Karenia_brevis.AAC.1